MLPVYLADHEIYNSFFFCRVNILGCYYTWMLAMYYIKNKRYFKIIVEELLCN